MTDALISHIRIFVAAFHNSIASITAKDFNYGPFASLTCQFQATKNERRLDKFHTCDCRTSSDEDFNLPP